MWKSREFKGILMVNGYVQQRLDMFLKLYAVICMYNKSLGFSSTMTERNESI